MGGGFSCNGFELDVMRRFPDLGLQPAHWQSSDSKLSLSLCQG